VSPTRPALRCICYCADCQAYAGFLGATSLLGPTGGTELIRLSPSQVAITCGKNALRCVRLTGRGPLRWYGRCCLTPIANTAADGRAPLLSLARTCLGNDAGALEASFGPVRVHLSPGSALASRRPPATGRFRSALSAAWLRFAAAATGGPAHTPFFDPATGRPIVDPQAPGHRP
jgi:hypothetical protein